MKVEANGFSAARAVFMEKPGNSSKLGAARPKPLRQKFPIRKNIFNFERAGHGPASSPEPCPNHKCASLFETNAMDRLI
jgi:hypothetical protein